jgi:two-component system cell cycle sensor histidine kinase/response regulator CckA
MERSGERKARTFEEGQRLVLERAAGGVPLRNLLEDITLLIERQRPGHMMCSLLLVDRAHGCVRHGAAPSLPADFVRRIDGSSIGPQAGSCGTAAYLGERVIVEDIATHPAWVDYRAFALPHGLRACWSSPIFSASRDVLGTFAMYYREPRGPDADDLELVEHATHLAAVAIQRDRAEAALRKTMLMRQIVFDGVVDVLYSIDVDAHGAFRFQCVNQAFTRATGLAEADVVGRLVSDVIPEPAYTAVLERYRTCIRERRTMRWDEVSAYPTGTRYGAVSISPVFDDDGVCTTLVGTVHDVTERKAAEERIRYQAALLDRASDAIVVRDLDGTVRYWNEGATRVYGWTAAEALGRRVTDLIYPGDTDAFERAQRCVNDLGAWKGEIEQRHKGGGALTIDASWTLLRDEQGMPLSVLAINTDVTERKKVDRHLLRSQRMESLGQLAGAIAHDFNNILAAILANTTMGKLEAAADAASGQFFDEIERAGARATALVRQILTFSRDQAPKRELVSLPAIVEESLRLVRATAPRTIELDTTIAPDVPAILAESTQVHQVIMNLCTNATHAIGDGAGRVSLRVDRAQLERGLVDSTVELLPGTYARLVVEDTGAGMSDATLERIFDPFFTTKAAGKGTGLGLAVVHGIMKSHQGGIVVRTTPGLGTTFTLYFPAA